MMSRLALLLVVLSTLAIGAGCGSQAQSRDAARCAAAEELDALLGRAGDIQNAQQALEGTFQLAIGEARHEPLEVRFAIARGFVATARNIAAQYGALADQAGRATPDLGSDEAAEDVVSAFDRAVAFYRASARQWEATAATLDDLASVDEERSAQAQATEAEVQRLRVESTAASDAAFESLAFERASDGFIVNC